jgi:nucleoside-diphosphate-sugar epimerase
VPLRDLILGVATRLGGEDLVRLGAVTVPTDEPPLVLADVRQLNELLDWRPSLDLEAGLDQTVEWWSRQQLDRGAA